MKTADEWAKDTGLDTFSAAVGVIKHIQLDAWKQGMTDATLAVQKMNWTKEYKGTEDAIIRTIKEFRDCPATLTDLTTHGQT